MIGLEFVLEPHCGLAPMFTGDFSKCNGRYELSSCCLNFLSLMMVKALTTEGFTLFLRETVFKWLFQHFFF